MLDPRVTLAVVLALGGSLVLLVWAMFTRGAPVLRPETLRFRCPFKRRDVTVEFRENAWDGALLEVRSCDVFAPPTAVACDRGCLHLPALPPAAARAA